MYNLRYHIASLAAVFLALAMGLILGGLAVGGGALESQQAALVEGLRKEFSTLRTQNADLTSDNEMLTAFAKQNNDAWVPGRLADKRFLVVAGVGRTDGVLDARRDIESAGGHVAVVTLLKPGLGLAEKAASSALASVTGTPDAKLESVAASLAAEWAGTGERPVTDALVAAGVLGVEGLEAGQAENGLVDVAAIEGASDPVGIALAKAFAENGGASVAAQTTTSGTGVAAAGSDAGVSAFDTLGTEVGRFTLVALMSGGEPGYYGFADGTDGAFPPFPTEESTD